MAQVALRGVARRKVFWAASSMVCLGFQMHLWLLHVSCCRVLDVFEDAVIFVHFV